MKLRILGNSIRVRIQQQELARLNQAGNISGAIQFGPNQRLTYTLVSTDNLSEVDVAFEDNEISVFIPRDLSGVSYSREYLWV